MLSSKPPRTGSVTLASTHRCRSWECVHWSWWCSFDRVDEERHTGSFLVVFEAVAAVGRKEVLEVPHRGTAVVLKGDDRCARDQLLQLLGLVAHAVCIEVDGENHCAVLRIRWKSRSSSTIESKAGCEKSACSARSRQFHRSDRAVRAVRCGLVRDTRRGMAEADRLADLAGVGLVDAGLVEAPEAPTGGWEGSLTSKLRAESPERVLRIPRAVAPEVPPVRSGSLMSSGLATEAPDRGLRAFRRARVWEVGFEPDCAAAVASAVFLASSFAHAWAGQPR